MSEIDQMFGNKAVIVEKEDVGYNPLEALKNALSDEDQKRKSLPVDEKLA